MKITIDTESGRSYGGAARFSEAAKEATKTKEEARFLFRQILAGDDEIIALNGTRFRRNKVSKR